MGKCTDATDVRYVLSTSVLRYPSATLQCFYTLEKLRQACLQSTTTSRWMATRHLARVLLWCMTHHLMICHLLVSSDQRRVSKRHPCAEGHEPENYQRGALLLQGHLHDATARRCCWYRIVAWLKHLLSTSCYLPYIDLLSVITYVSV